MRLLIGLTAILLPAAFAQTNGTLDSPYQVIYAANLNKGDAVINITNGGARGAGLGAGTGAAVTGAICVNIYAFSPDEQMVSCCACPVTPNGLVHLSARQDLISNTLTPAVPTSIVTKFLASTPIAGTCNPGGVVGLTPGIVVWRSGVQCSQPSGTPTTPTSASTECAQIETAAIPAALSEGELNRLTTLCTFIQANGSGFGICNSCRTGGLGGGRL